MGRLLILLIALQFIRFSYLREWGQDSGEEISVYSPQAPIEVCGIRMRHQDNEHNYDLYQVNVNPAVTLPECKTGREWTIKQTGGSSVMSDRKLGAKFLLCTSYNQIGIPDFIRIFADNLSRQGKPIIVLPKYIITSDNAENINLRIYKEVQIYNNYDPLQDNLRTAGEYIPIRFKYMIAMIESIRDLHQIDCTPILFDLEMNTSIGITRSNSYYAIFTARIVRCYNNLTTQTKRDALIHLMDLFFSEFPHRQIDDLHRMLHDYDDNVGRMVFDNPEDYSFVIQILASYVQPIAKLWSNMVNPLMYYRGGNHDVYHEEHSIKYDFLVDLNVPFQQCKTEMLQKKIQNFKDIIIEPVYFQMKHGVPGTNLNLVYAYKMRPLYDVLKAVNGFIPLHLKYMIAMIQSLGTLHLRGCTVDLQYMKYHSSIIQNPQGYSGVFAADIIFCPGNLPVETKRESLLFLMQFFFYDYMLENSLLLKHLLHEYEERVLYYSFRSRNDYIMLADILVLRRYHIKELSEASERIIALETPWTYTASVSFLHSNYLYRMEIFTGVTYDQCVSAQKEGRTTTVLVCVSQMEFTIADGLKQIIPRLMLGPVPVTKTPQSARLNPHIHENYKNAIVYDFEPLQSFIKTAGHKLRLEYMIAAIKTLRILSSFGYTVPPYLHDLQMNTGILSDRETSPVRYTAVFAVHIICKASVDYSDAQKGILKLLVPLFFNDYRNQIDFPLNRILSNYLQAVKGRTFTSDKDYNELINILAMALGPNTNVEYRSNSNGMPQAPSYTPATTENYSPPFHNTMTGLSPSSSPQAIYSNLPSPNHASGNFVSYPASQNYGQQPSYHKGPPGMPGQPIY